MNTFKIDQTEQLVSQLCSRFTNIFEQIREIKETRIDLEEENTNLECLIDEEQQKFELLQNHVGQVEEGLNMEAQKEQDLIDHQVKLKMEYDEKTKDIEVQQYKLKQVHSDLEQELNVKESMEAEIDHLSNQINSLEQKINENQDISANIDNNFAEIDQKNEEIQNKLKNLTLTADHNEDAYKKSVEEKCQAEDEYKLTLQEYRETLNNISNCEKDTKETEKVISKISDELRGKLRRLEIQVKNKMKLEKKLCKFKNMENEIHQLAEQNETLDQENANLRDMLEEFYEANNLPRDYNDSILEKSTFSIRTGNKQYGLVNKESNSPSDMLEELRKKVQHQDTQIYENKQLDKELDNEIEIGQEALREKTEEKDKLLNKLQLMKNSTLELGQKYESMCDEYGIEPYNLPTNINNKNEGNNTDREADRQHNYSNNNIDTRNSHRSYKSNKQQQQNSTKQQNGKKFYHTQHGYSSDLVHTYANFNSQSRDSPTKKLQFSQSSTPHRNNRDFSGLKTLD